MSLPIAREFVGGPWNGDLRAVDADDLLIRSHETIRTYETLRIDGQALRIAVFSQVHFIYEYDEIDDAFVCLVAGTKRDCEDAIARKLAEDE